MNTREFIKSDEEIVFYELGEEDELLFRKYIETSRHFQEITQLYNMMLFDLDELFLHYDLHFDDRVFSKNGEEVDAIQINALVGNAVSAARTLIESIGVIDKVYIDKEEYFKKNFISKVYDENFCYRFIDFIRNYLQHGHVPISFDGEKIFFLLSEILDVSHMKINPSLNQKMKDIEQQLFSYGELNPRLAVVQMLYKYFLLVHVLMCEFLKYMRMHFLALINEVYSVLDDHPEYILQIHGAPFVAVYWEDNGTLHGFAPDSDARSDIDNWISYTEQKLQEYENNNGHLFFFKITYCLENRMPVMSFIDDDALSQNLEEFCLKTGAGIDYLSFDTYYGKMEMNAVYRLYPYIQFEDGIRWNVPYQDVTIEDFIRTFPQVREEGLEAFANNVGGADEFLQRVIQDWSSYLFDARQLLSKVGINSPIDALDWLSRITFVWQGMQWLGKSFAKRKKEKPCIRDLRNYIRRRTSWNINELEKNLHAQKELLVIVLEELGYVCQNDSSYKYDSKTAERLEQERNNLLQRRYDNHGSNVDCYRINLAIEQLNADLMYLAVLAKEAGELDSYDFKVQELIRPLKDCIPYIGWDNLCKEVRIAELLPESFCEENAERVWDCIEKVDKCVNDNIRGMERDVFSAM